MTTEQMDYIDVQHGAIRVVEHHPRRGHHRCRLPGWWRRRRLNIGPGTKVECIDCRKRWVLDGDEHGAYWTRDWGGSPGRVTHL